ncbi:MAG TPA: carboxymuconolactone decarboxylase family protein [Chloroflexota bacterium]|jgi:alkylhydroperoxidase/carboxymuconolactone decarboxylase family protein YurZ
MATTRARNPMEIVTDSSAATAEAFQALRKAVNEAGPLPQSTRELIVSSNFATLGVQGAFMTHAKRALDGGATIEELRHAVLLTLGANAPFPRVAAALGWVDELAGK